MLKDEIPLKLYQCRKKNRSSHGSCVTCKADLEDDSMFENLSSGIGGNGARNEVGRGIPMKREGAGCEPWRPYEGG